MQENTRKKLSISKETLKNLSVKTGVMAGDGVVTFPPDRSATCSCTSCTCANCPDAGAPPPPKPNPPGPIAGDLGNIDFGNLGNFGGGIF